MNTEEKFNAEKEFYAKMQGRSVYSFLKEYLKQRTVFTSVEIQKELELPAHMKSSVRNPINYSLKFLCDDGYLTCLKDWTFKVNKVQK
jgi:hypothetical protein